MSRSYWDTGFIKMFSSRAPWLSILVLVNLVSSGVIALFEDALSSSVASGPLITTVADAFGLLIYFSTARLVMGI